MWPNFLLDIWHNGEACGSERPHIVPAKAAEISPAINMRRFSKLVARLLFREYHFKNGF